MTATAAGPSTKPTATSGADGIALLTGLQGTYALSASGDAGTATIDQQSVQLNQTDRPSPWC